MESLITNENANKRHLAFLGLMIVNWIFYLWVFRNTPYGIDDWAWGLPIGWEWFVTGQVNGRYLGNLFEIIVTRSQFLKTILLSLIAALFPVLSVQVAFGWSAFIRKNDDNNLKSIHYYLMASIMFASIPIYIWRQTYGWVAGFSNYGLSTFLVLCYQLIQLYSFRNSNSHVSELILIGLFGVASQLVVENISIFLLIVSILTLLVDRIVRKQWNQIMLALFVGNLVGIAIMFGGSYYNALFRDGKALGGFRGLIISDIDGLFPIIKVMFIRFAWLFPLRLWEDNWLVCGAISVALFVKCIHSFKTKKIRKLLLIFFLIGILAFLFVFSFIHFVGPLENYLQKWNYVLSTYLSLSYFGFVIIAVVFLYFDNKKRMLLLLCLWISAPFVVFPLTATNVMDSPESQSGRLFLTPTVFMIEFFLTMIKTEDNYMISKQVKQLFLCSLIMALMLSLVHKSVIYYKIGEGMKERKRLIENARTEEVEMIFFPDFEHLEFLWTTEPTGEIMRESFRQFYDIPEGIELRFNTLEWAVLSNDEEIN